ncbi:MAG: hypothetical protein HON04_05520 [Planctomicrobium sp.]|jgi:hypothetical protein|nr:hypothetical protein [Planctomicrobium sp.]
MNNSNYQKILKVVRQQARMAAYELARLNEIQQVLVAEQSSIQTIIAEYNNQFEAQFQRKLSSLRTEMNSDINVDQLTAVHHETERLKNRLSELRQRHEQNETRRVEFQTDYQRLHAKETALEKLIERQKKTEQEQLLKSEEIELAEFSNFKDPFGPQCGPN